MAMTVVIDGLIYQCLAHGGIPRLYDEILPRMCEMEKALSIELLTSGRLLHPLPLHASIHQRSLPPVDRVLRPQRLWGPVVWSIRELIQRLSVGSGKGRIWHSTYYTKLGRWWDGRSVVTVLDMIHERFTHLFSGSFNEQFRQRKRQCIMSADTVICISKTTQQDLQQFYGIVAAKTRVVPLAANTSPLQEPEAYVPGIQPMATP